MSGLFDLSDDVAVVTGAGRGIGEGIANTLAEAGAAVVCAARRGEEVEAVAAGIRARGGRAIALATGATATLAGSATAGYIDGVGTNARFNTLRRLAADGAGNLYVSDFGNVTVVANRFQRERDALVLDPEYASVAYLRPFQQMELAKTGDAEKRLLIVEYGLKITSENAHGLAADLTS